MPFLAGCGSISFANEIKICPPKKRAAATKPSCTIVTWFCRGLSVPCSSGRRGHVLVQTDPLPGKRRCNTRWTPPAKRAYDFGEDLGLGAILSLHAQRRKFHERIFASYSSRRSG